MPDWSPEATSYTVTPPLRPRIHKHKFHDIELPEKWEINLLPARPIHPRFLDIPSTLYSSAKEIEAKPMLKMLTYSYEDTKD